MQCPERKRSSGTGYINVADRIIPLTDDDRVNAFVVDDSLFERTSCKRTELGSKVFDHVSMKYRKGYRLMTLGWTDGNTFLPINSSLLASSQDDNLIGRSAAMTDVPSPQSEGNLHR